MVVATSVRTATAAVGDTDKLSATSIGANMMNR